MIQLGDLPKKVLRVKSKVKQTSDNGQEFGELVNRNS